MNHGQGTDSPTTNYWTDPAVEDAYRVLLRSIGDSALEDVALTSHWPLVGNASERVLVVGQAVFGWVPNWRPVDVAQEDGISRVLRETQAIFYDLPDPMEWIAASAARTSPSGER